MFTAIWLRWDKLGIGMLATVPLKFSLNPPSRAIILTIKERQNLHVLEIFFISIYYKKKLWIKSV